VGIGGDDIFLCDDDRERFLETPGEACVRADWQVPAYCLMGNHFHMVLEMPLPTLVSGMKWMPGTYTRRFNARHRLRGHLFAGRYKALSVDESDVFYLRTVCDYGHLNPVRARLVSGEAAIGILQVEQLSCVSGKCATSAGVAEGGSASGRAWDRTR